MSSSANTAERQALARSGGATIGGTRVDNTNYTVLPTDVQIEVRGLTAGRTITLWDVDTFPTGQPLLIGDFDGTCSPDRPITIQVGAGTGDTIAGQTAIQIADPYGSLEFRAGITDTWIAR